MRKRKRQVWTPTEVDKQAAMAHYLQYIAGEQKGEPFVPSDDNLLDEIHEFMERKKLK